jgi:hypothetical protein
MRVCTKRVVALVPRRLPGFGGRARVLYLHYLSDHDGIFSSASQSLSHPTCRECP